MPIIISIHDLFGSVKLTIVIWKLPTVFLDFGGNGAWLPSAGVRCRYPFRDAIG